MQNQRGNVLIIIIGIIAIVGVGVGLGYFLAQNMERGQKQEVANKGEVADKQETASSEIWLDIEWEKNLVRLSQEEYKSIVGVYNKENPVYEYEEGRAFFAGIVKNSEYQGLKLYLEEVPGGPGSPSYSHFIIKNNVKVGIGDKIKIKGIHDLPEYIELRGTSYKLKRGYVGSLFSDIVLSQKIFTDERVGNVYSAENGCIFIELPDHTAIDYDLDIPFANKENGIIDFMFSDGSKNKESYTFNKIIGCGALCYYLAIKEENDLMPSDRFKMAGVTESGESLFYLKDQNDPVLKNLYDDKNTVAYFSEDWQSQPTNKYNYGAFIDYHPLLYWKDPLGRWIEFKNKRFEIAAEMCKPVIYLYPEEKTVLNVKVFPSGGFTFTEPDYDNGWNIEVDQSGKIKDLATSRMYDYLFWEGIGLNYPVEDRGWVIKKEHLDSFFDNKLKQFGMQGREVSDFKEYWLARLSASPYYQISFLNKEQINEIAPLSISPVKPKNVLRVIMTAQGLNKPVNIAPQDLNIGIANRDGFTVVEWGGVVLK